MKRETLLFPFILIIIMILRFIIRSSRGRDVGEDGEKSRKLYRYVGCADEEGPTPPSEPKI